MEQGDDNEGGYPIQCDDLKVDDRIIIVLKKENHLDRGYVRYVGELPGVKGTYYGIELDEPKGVNDGKTYFKAKDKHGTFIQLNYLRKILKEDFNKSGFNAILKKEQQERLAKKKEEATQGGQKADENSSPEKSEVATPKQFDKPEASPEKPTQVAETTNKLEKSQVINEEKPLPKQPESPTKVEKPVIKPSPVQPSKDVKKPTESQKTIEKPIDKSAVSAETKSDATQEQPKFNLQFYERKIKDLENSYTELTAKREKDMNTLKGRIRSLEEQLSKEKEKSAKQSEFAYLETELNKMEEKYNNMSTEYESLKYELEKTTMNLDEAQFRIQELELDKEEMMLQAELLTEDDAPMTEEDKAELKKNFGLLKMAYSKLEERQLYDKEKFDQKILNLEEKLKNNDGVSNEKVKKMLAEKDQIIEDLKLRLDDTSGTNEYITNLTEQLINARNQTSAAEENVKELKKTLRLNDEIIEEIEEMNGLLSSEVDTITEELNSLKEQNQIYAHQIKESDDIIAKYREKMKLFQGEIDIIKSQSSEVDDQDKIKKIDQLVKNYTACLQEKRIVVKKLISSEYKDIKDAKQNLKWNIVMKSIPSRIIQELESPALDKLLNLLELVKKIDLIVNQMKSNYLQNPLVVEDNVELIRYISSSIEVLLVSKRNIEYLLDYGFSLEKYEDLKSLTRAQIFGVLVSYEVLLDKLITEIREDSFSIKFNLKLLEDNNSKIITVVSELSNEFKLVQSKESIDLRFYSKVIELQYLASCGIIENAKQMNENLKSNIVKVCNVSSNIEYDRCWHYNLEDNIKKSKLPADQRTDEEEEKLFHLNKIVPFYEVLLKTVPELLKTGSNKLEIMESIEEDTKRYVLSNAKKPKKRDEEDEYPFRLFSENGPWIETVNFIKTKLEKFKELQQENLDKISKIEELNKKFIEAEQKIENSQKIKATLENRIKDLEFKNQNIPIIEGDRLRSNEQIKILQADIDKLKKDLANMEEKGRLNALTLHSQTISNAVTGRRQEGKANPFSKDQSMVKPRAGREENRSDLNNAKNILTYERIIENLHNQLLKKEEDNIFDPVRMMKEMPHFYKIYSTEKRKAAFDNDLDDIGRNALSQLTHITNQVKSKVLSKRIVDLSACTEKDPVKRLQLLNSKIAQEERDLTFEREKASQIFTDLQSKWLNTYSNNYKDETIYSKLLTDSSQSISTDKVVGRITINSKDTDPSKAATVSKRIFVNSSNISLNNIIKL